MPSSWYALLLSVVGRHPLHALALSPTSMRTTMIAGSGRWARLVRGSSLRVREVVEPHGVAGMPLHNFAYHSGFRIFCKGLTDAYRPFTSAWNDRDPTREEVRRPDHAGPPTHSHALITKTLRLQSSPVGNTSHSWPLGTGVLGRACFAGQPPRARLTTPSRSASSV